MASKPNPANCKPLFPIGMTVLAFDADWPGIVTEIREHRSGDPRYHIVFSDYISSWVRQSSIIGIPEHAQAPGNDGSAKLIGPAEIPTAAMAGIHETIAGHPPMACCTMGL